MCDGRSAIQFSGDSTSDFLRCRTVSCLDPMSPFAPSLDCRPNWCSVLLIWGFALVSRPCYWRSTSPVQWYRNRPRYVPGAEYQMASHRSDSVDSNWFACVVCRRSIYVGRGMWSVAIDVSMYRPTAMRMRVRVVMIEFDFAVWRSLLATFSFEVLRSRDGPALAVACIGILWPGNCAATPAACLAIVWWNTRRTPDAHRDFCKMGKLRTNTNKWMSNIEFIQIDEILQNHSFHSDCECSSGANFVKNSVIFSCFPDANAVTRYNFNSPNSSFLTAVGGEFAIVPDYLPRELAMTKAQSIPEANECSNLLNRCPSKWFQMSRSDCKSCEFIEYVIWSMILSTRKPLSLSDFSSVSNDFNVFPKPRNSKYSRISESTYWIWAIIFGFCSKFSNTKSTTLAALMNRDIELIELEMQNSIFNQFALAPKSLDFLLFLFSLYYDIFVAVIAASLSHSHAIWVETPPRVNACQPLTTKKLRMSQSSLSDVCVLTFRRIEGKKNSLGSIPHYRLLFLNL